MGQNCQLRSVNFILNYIILRSRIRGRQANFSSSHLCIWLPCTSVRRRGKNWSRNWKSKSRRRRHVVEKSQTESKTFDAIDVGHYHAPLLWWSKSGNWLGKCSTSLYAKKFPAICYQDRDHSQMHSVCRLFHVWKQKHKMHLAGLFRMVDPILHCYRCCCCYDVGHRYSGRWEINTAVLCTHGGIVGRSHNVGTSPW